jgi:hypothetical protein
MNRGRRFHAAAGAFLVGIALSGCGASPSGVDSPEATTTAQTPTSDGTTTSEETSRSDGTATSTETSTTGSQDPVSYVPWGPDDPVIPQHYGDLARRDCTAAQASSPEGSFWDAVIAVCRTLTRGDPWPALTEAPSPPETGNPHDQCLNSELVEMVTAALAWHAENGDSTPEAHYADTGSACYRKVYEARQVQPEDDPSGPPPGELSVAVVVDATYDLSSVSVDGNLIDSADYINAGNDPQIGLRTVSLHLPAPQSATRLTIELALKQEGADRGIVTASVEVAPTSADASAAASEPAAADVPSDSPTADLP